MLRPHPPTDSSNHARDPGSTSPTPSASASPAWRASRSWFSLLCGGDSPDVWVVVQIGLTHAWVAGVCRTERVVTKSAHAADSEARSADVPATCGMALGGLCGCCVGGTVASIVMLRWGYPGRVAGSSLAVGSNRPLLVRSFAGG